MTLRDSIASRLCPLCDHSIGVTFCSECDRKCCRECMVGERCTECDAPEYRARAAKAYEDEQRMQAYKDRETR